MKPKLLITGGAGFLGYHAAEILHAKGYECELLDIAAYEPSEYPAGTAMHHCDVRDRESLEKLLSERKYDLVMHGAAALPLWKKKDIYDTNITGTRNVLEFSFKYGVKRVVYISSTAVHGVPRRHPIMEDDPLIGVGPYGESKILAEAVCREFREKGFCVPILRPKSFIGTGRLGVFQILYDWVESGKRIPVIGNGKNRYQLFEVDDLVEAIHLALSISEERANNTFNLGAKEFRTVNEDVGALCEYAGNGARVMHTPARLVKSALWVFEKLGVSPLYKWIYDTADRDSFVSIEKAEGMLGWTPKESNASALIKSYQWYIEHKSEADSRSGVTHRVAWKQGVLRLFKKIM